MGDEKVISLQAKREEKNTKEKGRTITGKARCLSCGHEWEHTAPEGENGHYDLWHKCPSCGLQLGRFVYDVCENEPVWTCGGCGNELFKVTQKHIFCPVCGKIQEFP
ncbi:MAG TPA: hypothetical protein PKI80_03765 [Deltaproteobacteria bacterium]|nr:hypothetical protein [Deltaproteobacteria bacterium]HNS82729.1 hypothetical protein [Methanolinea sp.]